MFKGAVHPPEPTEPQRIEIDAALSWTDREQLRKADFDTMSEAEWTAARKLLERIDLFFARLQMRREVVSARGRRVDLRDVLRHSARRGGEVAVLRYRRRRRRPEPLVVLVDISGSMSRYSRMFLHFLHAITAGRESANYRVHSFLFGTRLTHVTRQLAARDPDVAVRAVVQAVDDWSGGTRITQALHEFNFKWARRVLYGNPTVLLVTDGLSTATPSRWSAKPSGWRKPVPATGWLNPLPRDESFEPRAGGVRALLPHVDAFLPVHNLASLEALAAGLAAPRVPRATDLQEKAKWN